MIDPSLPGSHGHSIADVERDTGLAKDTLRVWERRYGFPSPARDPQGERRYSDDDLARLRHVRRLLDAGHRPGRVVALPLAQLLALDTQPSAGRMQAPAENGWPEGADWLALMQRMDAAGLRDALQRSLAERGLARTVTDTVAPLSVQVGLAWLDGRLAVPEEHLFSEAVQQVLRPALAQAMAARPSQPPRVLLTTVPGEPHSLGLLMAECLLVLEGCETVPLGVQTPLVDISRAAVAARADVVALGFSAMQSAREVQTQLARLREALPPEVALWAGGRGVAGRRPRLAPRAHWPLPRLQDIAVAVARWRAEAAQRASAAARTA